MDNKFQISTIYGQFDIAQPLIDLLNTDVMRRLKKISMGGITQFIKNSDYKDYSRYEHSINVVALLIIYGAGSDELISGLLHDASHTVFSHVGDVLFGGSQDECYQDKMHEWFLKYNQIDKVLDKYRISLSSILHKDGTFKLLEQDLPDICIDRLDYNLMGALNNGLLTHKMINEILKNLKFDKGKWFFTSKETARVFAKVPLTLNERHWAAPHNVLAYDIVAKAMKVALDNNIITNDEVHFSDDNEVWNKLKHSKNIEILSYIEQVENIKDIFFLSTHDNCDLIVTGKFRGIDPFVQTASGFARLTEISSEFKADYERLSCLIKKGWAIKFRK